MLRTANGWISQCQKKGALWIHDGNPEQPHALLTSGNHSNGFFNSELIMEDPFLLNEACIDLVELLRDQCFDIDTVDRVVGPAMGAITLAHDLARRIDITRCEFVRTVSKPPRPCLRAYTEKHEIDRLGQIILTFKRTSIYPGERILLCEDVLTTGNSVDLTATTVTNIGGIVLPFVVVLVNRSGLTETGGKKVVALINRFMQIWTPDECPLCKKKGSEAIRPKDIENWARLNANY